MLLQLFALNDEKLTAFTFNHAAQVDELGKATGDYQIVQTKFDSRGEEIRVKHNSLVDYLATTAASGEIGSAAITGVTGATIFTQLQSLKTLIDDDGSDITALELRVTDNEDDIVILQGRMTTAEGNITTLQNAVGDRQYPGATYLTSGQSVTDSLIVLDNAMPLNIADDSIGDSKLVPENKVNVDPTYAVMEGILDSVLDNTLGRRIAWAEWHGQTLVNSVENGDFSDGTTGWTTGGNWSIASEKASYTNLGLGYIQKNDLAFEVGEKVCIAFTVSNSTDDGARLIPATNLGADLLDGVGYETYEDGTQSIVGTVANASTQLRFYATNATGGGSFDLDNVAIIRMTALGIEHYTEEQMLKLVRKGYIDGLQGVQNPEAKSVGENILDLEGFTRGKLLGNTGLEFSNISFGFTKPIMAKQNTTYYVSSNANSGGAGVNYLDGDNHIIGSAVTLPTNGGAFTTVEGTMYIQINVALSDVDANTSFVVEGAVALSPRQPYEATHFKAFTTLHRLPNGVEDKLYRDGAGKFRKDKRIAELTLTDDVLTGYTTSGTNTDYVTITMPSNYKPGTSGVDGQVVIEGFGTEVEFGDSDTLDAIGHFYSASITIRLIVANGYYANLAEAQADLAGTKIIYELAEPVQELVAVENDLQLFDTIYNPGIGELDLNYPTNTAGRHAEAIRQGNDDYKIIYKDGEFTADELPYGFKGIDKTNNRVYWRYSDTQVIYVAGTVV